MLFYTATAPLPGLYVGLRYHDWGLAGFSSAVFWLLCVYLTMVRPHLRSWLVCISSSAFMVPDCSFAHVPAYASS